MSKEDITALINAIYMWGNLSKDRNLTIKMYIKSLAEMIEDFALMNQDDLDRGKGFNLLMNLVKELRDE
jgi:hypothetical protein